MKSSKKQFRYKFDSFRERNDEILIKLLYQYSDLYSLIQAENNEEEKELIESKMIDIMILIDIRKSELQYEDMDKLIGRRK